MDRKKAELILRSFLFLRIISPRRFLGRIYARIYPHDIGCLSCCNMCSGYIASSLKCYHFRTCEGGKPPFNPPFTCPCRGLAFGYWTLSKPAQGFAPQPHQRTAVLWNPAPAFSPSDPLVVHARPSAIESSKQASPRQGSPPAPDRRP